MLILSILTRLAFELSDGFNGVTDSVPEYG